MENGRNEVKIAVLEEQIKGVREQHKTQYDTLEKMLDEQKGELSAINGKMDDVVAYKNKQKGWTAAISTVMGTVGGTIGGLFGIKFGG